MQGYDYFGLTRKGKSTVYREWAPAAAGAQLIGDFNDWHGTHMQRVEGGAWEVTIPDSECWAAEALPGVVIAVMLLPCPCACLAKKAVSGGC